MQVVEERRERFAAVNEVWDKIVDLQREVRELKEAGPKTSAAAPVAGAAGEDVRSALLATQRDIQQLKEAVSARPRLSQVQGADAAALNEMAIALKRMRTDQDASMRAMREALDADLSKQGEAITAACGVIKELQHYVDKRVKDFGKRLDSAGAVVGAAPPRGTSLFGGGGASAAAAETTAQLQARLAHVEYVLDEQVAEQARFKKGVAEAHGHIMRASRLALLAPELTGEDRRRALAALDEQETRMRRVPSNPSMSEGSVVAT